MNTGRAQILPLMIVRRLIGAFGNSTGDREMLVVPQDFGQECVYRPAFGLPVSNIKTFALALMDETRTRGNDGEALFITDQRAQPEC